MMQVGRKTPNVSFKRMFGGQVPFGWNVYGISSPNARFSRVPLGRRLEAMLGGDLYTMG